MQPSVLRDIFLDVIMFPIWWYSRGLVLLMEGSLAVLEGYSRRLAIGVWMKNIFVPMFGTSDWQSRLISIFMRSVQIVGRSFVLMGVALAVALGGLVYLALPITLLLLAAYNIMGSLLYAV